MRIEDVWREIEAVVDRAELRAAVEAVSELVPHLDEDDEGDMRARLSERIRLVSGFLRELCEVIELGSNAEGRAGAARRCGGCRGCSIAAASSRPRTSTSRLVRGSWRRLVYGQPAARTGRSIATRTCSAC